jgi:uncharacterized protein (DUF433 family)
MALATTSLSVNEVAVVADVPPRAVNEIVDKAILPSRFVVRGARRALLPQACYLVAVYWNTGDQLTGPERVRIVNRVSDQFERDASPVGMKTWRLPNLRSYVLHDDVLTIDLRPILRKVERGGDLLDEARAIVVIDPNVLGGMPVIKGTRIPVHDVAASVRNNIPMERILRAYPDLTRRKIELATVWSDAHPPRGKPRRVADDIPTAKLRSEVRVARKAG